MARTVVVTQIGPPEVMQVTETEPGLPGPGQIRVRQTAIGVNFVDVHYRRGSFPPVLPLVPGVEAAGVIDAIGPGVSEMRPGDRVAYATSVIPSGAYTEMRLLPAEWVVKLPTGVSERDAAATLFKGITAHGMIHSVRPIQAGDVVMVHAAAGGVGSILARWAKHLGATVIGTVGSPEKVERARAQGCDHVLVYALGNVAADVQKATDGHGVDVLYDGVGQDTFTQSVECMAPRGTMVSFGEASGKIGPFDLGRLNPKSLSVTKYSVRPHIAATEEYQSRARAVLDAVKRGILARNDYRVYSLADAPKAHRNLEGRTSTGSLILEP